MAAITYSVERHETSGELFIIEWTGGIDGPTGVHGPISEERFRAIPLEQLVSEAKFGPDALGWYAELSWIVIDTTER